MAPQAQSLSLAGWLVTSIVESGDEDHDDAVNVHIILSEYT